MLTDTYLWISNHVLVHMFMSLQTMYVVCTPIHRQCFQQTIWRYSRCLLWSNEVSDGNVWCLRPREREHNNISGFPYLNHVLVHRFMSLQAMCVFAHIFLDNVASRQFEGVQKMSFMKQWSKWWKCLVPQPKRIPFEREHNNISGFPYSRICLSLHLSTLLLKGCSGWKHSCIYIFNKICVLDQLPSQDIKSL